MLAKYYRLRAKWSDDADQTLTYANGARINVRLTPGKFVSGVWTPNTTITDDMGFNSGTIVAGGESEGDVQDNTSDADTSLKGYVELISDVSGTDGTLYLYLEESDTVDDFWISDGTDFDIINMRKVAALKVATSGVDQTSRRNFEF